MTTPISKRKEPEPPSSSEQGPSKRHKRNAGPPPSFGDDELREALRLSAAAAEMTSLSSPPQPFKYGCIHEPLSKKHREIHQLVVDHFRKKKGVAILTENQLQQRLQKKAPPESAIKIVEIPNLGKGVFLSRSAKPIRKGTPLAVYGGEIQLAYRNRTAQTSLYKWTLFDFDEEDKNSPDPSLEGWSEFVDGQKSSSFPIFVNACHPDRPEDANVDANVFLLKRRGETDTVQILYMTCKEIPPGAQFIINYGAPYFENLKIVPLQITPTTYTLDEEDQLVIPESSSSSSSSCSMNPAPADARAASSSSKRAPLAILQDSDSEDETDPSPAPLTSSRSSSSSAQAAAPRPPSPSSEDESDSKEQYPPFASPPAHPFPRAHATHPGWGYLPPPPPQMLPLVPWSSLPLLPQYAYTQGSLPPPPPQYAYAQGSLPPPPPEILPARVLSIKPVSILQPSAAFSSSSSSATPITPSRNQHLASVPAPRVPAPVEKEAIGKEIEEKIKKIRAFLGTLGISCEEELGKLRKALAAQNFPKPLFDHFYDRIKDALPEPEDSREQLFSLRDKLHHFNKILWGKEASSEADCWKIFQSEPNPPAWWIMPHSHFCQKFTKDNASVRPHVPYVYP